MDDGEDEEEARAARLDGWIIWEAEERGANLTTLFSCVPSCTFFLVITSFVKGDSYPEFCAQRTAEGGGSLRLFLSYPGGEPRVFRFVLSFM
jgi:hypothetical protein